MEHPCYKCGHIVEDGRPFCGQCGAPQIRVVLPEGPVLASSPGVSSTDLRTLKSFPERELAVSANIVWPVAIRACAIAALICVAVMALRLVFPLVADLGAGCLAVILYRRRDPAWASTARSGAQVGGIATALSSAVVAVCFAIFLAVMESGGEVRQEVLERLQQLASRSNDAQVQATLNLLKAPDGASRLILAMLAFCLLSIVAGSLAGALTGAFFERKKRP